MARTFSVLVAACLTCMASTADAAPPPLRLAVEAHGSFLSNQADRSLLNVTFGGALRIGYRRDESAWGGYILFEQNAWLATELFSGVVAGVRNYGVGVERIWADGIVRTSVSAGLSVLAFETELHKKNTVGLYFDFRPATLRWEVHRSVAIELTPFHFAVVAPVLEPPELVNVEYRTTLGVEFSLR